VKETIREIIMVMEVVVATAGVETIINKVKWNNYGYVVLANIAILRREEVVNNAMKKDKHIVKQNKEKKDKIMDNNNKKNNKHKMKNLLVVGEVVVPTTITNHGDRTIMLKLNGEAVMTRNQKEIQVDRIIKDSTEIGINALMDKVVKMEKRN